ncbi:monovalent cation:proton antiporter-2 (CPA2) family protein [Pleionea litopenaei]|uniref:Monovalent cation:proton antiporter-2 (CPA2) family protein n=1 Tax=Pleionea litopenaei TaxID=3070815 RepID=A0AA51X5J2_9GAMM|nr:monovalent cation:proton antiporter-2 (CPA2) family protein [Pleionea sp. HL-JVS1]WMS85676.1 monovalent cation:proton antiporter-2 (CPA2) family protein [Pleionea sp. HL-JVS1]
MADNNILTTFLLFLIAAVIAVPLFRKIKLGAILGYLVAGILLGPFGVGSVADPDAVLHFAEIGVVLLLFVIGLELDPDKLWSMRRHIVFLGSFQLVICAAIIALVVWMVTQEQASAIVIGLALALSSTAFAIQLMAERGVMARQQGRRGFAILLFQDLAVIPILFVVGALSVNTEHGESVSIIWSVAAVIALLIIGKFLAIPVLALVSRYGSRETMTAASLLIVVGAAYFLNVAGLSMGMGAFIAGILLANSSFKHQLESDIEPFKGMTLGLFFIAIGMTLDLQLLWQKLWLVLVFAVSLMIFKSIVIASLLRMANIEWRNGISVALMLSQGGEFAFVIMAQASSGGVIATQTADMVNLVVGLSMAFTAPLVGFFEWMYRPRVTSVTLNDEEPSFESTPEVLILGFGRFGQTTGRILAADRIPFIAIDKDAEHIEFVRRFGNKVFFGDAERLDVLQAAGIEQVKVVLLAIDNTAQMESIVRLIRQHYPQVRIIARARNRSAYWSLKAAGADEVIREVFEASLKAASQALMSIGFSSGESMRRVDAFAHHDTQVLNDTYAHRDDIDRLIEIGRQGRADLERLFDADRK